MSISVTGTIKYVDIGTGTWALESEEGMSYELYEAPQPLLEAGLMVKVEGQVRDDVMTMAMIGPVLEVLSFEAIG